MSWTWSQVTLYWHWDCLLHGSSESQVVTLNYHSKSQNWNWHPINTLVWVHKLGAWTWYPGASLVHILPAALVASRRCKRGNATWTFSEGWQVFKSCSDLMERTTDSKYKVWIEHEDWIILTWNTHSLVHCQHAISLLMSVTIPHVTTLALSSSPSLERHRRCGDQKCFQLYTLQMLAVYPLVWCRSTHSVASKQGSLQVLCGALMTKTCLCDLRVCFEE